MAAQPNSELRQLESTTAFLDNLVKKTNLSDDDVAKLCLQSTNIVDIQYQHFLNTAAQTVNNRVNLPVVSVDAILTDARRRSLTESFSRWRLDFKNVDGEAHAFARAHRRLSFYLLLSHLGFPSDLKGKRLRIKDIGGNPIPHFNMNRTYIHCCCPILDYQDQFRHAAFNEYLANGYSCGFSNTHERIMANQRRRFVCNRVAQDCPVKVDYLLFLHSIYNIDFNDVDKIFAASGASSAVGCFIFDPIVFVRDTGYLDEQECFYNIFIGSDNRKYISFNFRNDTSLSYTHLFSQYVSLVTTFSFGRNNEYLYNITCIKNQVAYFKIVMAASVMKCKITRTIPFHFDDTYTVVYTWRYDTVPHYTTLREWATSAPSRVRLVVPTRLVNLISSYLVQLPDKNKSIDSVMAAAISFSRREVIGGATITINTDVPVEDIIYLTYAIYLNIYILNYEASKGFSELKNKVDTTRARNSSSMFYRLFKKIFTISAPSVVHHCDPVTLKSVDDFTSILPFSSPASRVVTWINDTYFNYDQRVLLSKVNFLTLQHEFEILASVVPPVNYDNDLLPFLYNHYNMSAPKDKFTHQYITLRPVGLAPGQPTDLQSKVNVYIDYTNLSQVIYALDIVSVESPSVLFIGDDRAYVFGDLSNAVPYFFHNNILCSSVNVPFCMTAAVPFDVVEYYNKYFFDKTVVSLKNYYPLSGAHIKHVSSSVFKFVSMLNTFYIPIDFKVVCTLGGPGSDALYYLTRCLKVYGFTLKSTDPSKPYWCDELLRHPHFIDLSSSNSGNLFDVSATAVFKKYYGTFDFCSFDLSTGASDSLAIFCRSFQLALALLKPGGNAIIKIQDVSYLDHIVFDSGFNKIVIHKPVYNALSSEVFAVCLNRCDVVPIVEHDYLSVICNAIQYANDAKDVGVDKFFIPPHLTFNIPLFKTTNKPFGKDFPIASLNPFKCTLPVRTSSFVAFSDNTVDFRNYTLPVVINKTARFMCTVKNVEVLTHTPNLVNIVQEVAVARNADQIKGFLANESTIDGLYLEDYVSNPDAISDDMLPFFFTQIVPHNNNLKNALQLKHPKLNVISPSLLDSIISFFSPSITSFNSELVYTENSCDIGDYNITDFSRDVLSSSVPDKFNVLYTRGDGNCGIYSLFGNDVDPTIIVNAVRSSVDYPRYCKMLLVSFDSWVSGTYLDVAQLALVASCFGYNLVLYNGSVKSFTKYNTGQTKDFFVHYYSAHFSAVQQPNFPIVIGGAIGPVEEYLQYAAQCVQAVRSNSCLYDKIILEALSTAPLHTYDKEKIYYFDADCRSFFGKKKNIDDYMYFFCKGVVYPITCWDEHFRVHDCLTRGTAKYVQINAMCLRGTELYVHEELSKLRTDFCTQPKLVQAGAGCGKTYDIVHRSADHKRCAIVTSSNEAADDLRRRVKCPVFNFTQFLLNCHKHRGDYDTIFFDEAKMQHPGSVLLCANIAEAKNIYVYGDGVQIGFEPRVVMQLNYSSYESCMPIEKYLLTSYRVPPVIAFVMDREYKHFFGQVSYNTYRENYNSVNDVTRVLFNAYPNVDAYDIILCFTTFEKEQLQSKYTVKVLTAAQAQGGQWRNVAVIRLNPVVNHPMFANRYIINTLITRHTHKFTYFLNYDHDDGLTQKIREILATPERVALQHLRLRGGFTSAALYKYIPSDVSYFSNMKHPDAVLYSEDLPSSPVIQHLHVPSHIFKDTSYLVCYNRLHKRFPNARLSAATPTTRVALADTVKFMTRNSLYCGPAVENFKPFLDSSDLLRFTPLLRTTSFDYVRSVQSLLSIICGPRTYSDNKFDHVLVQLNSIDLPFESTMRINPVKSHSKIQIDRPALTPVLVCPVARRRPVSQIEVILGALKRNFNVPRLSGFVDVDRLSDSMVKNITKIFNFDDAPICTSSYSLTKWLSTQGSIVHSKLEASDPIWCTAGDIYDYSLKRDIKKVIPDFLTCYQAVQTLSAHPKNINALYSPLFIAYREKILRAAPANLLLFTCINTDQLNNFLPPDLTGFEFTEYDISKYDKSQDLLACIVELKLMKAIGFPTFLADVWFTMRYICTMRDSRNDIKFTVLNQMKSGVASTFISNTMHQMSVFFNEYKYNLKDYYLFCGDDQLLIRHPLTSSKFDLPTVALRYNFEIKKLSFKYKYFAGKFLVSNGCTLQFVPDPVKFFLCLARSDIPNYTMLNEIFGSYTDLFSNVIFSPALCYNLSLAVADRYYLPYPPLDIISSIPMLLKNYRDLFYVKDGVILDESIVYNVKY